MTIQRPNTPAPTPLPPREPGYRVPLSSPRGSVPFSMPIDSRSALRSTHPRYAAGGTSRWGGTVLVNRVAVESAYPPNIGS